MSKKLEIEEFRNKKYFHSSCYLEYLISLINDDLVYYMGIFDQCKFYYFITNTTVVFTLIKDNEIITEKFYVVDILHSITEIMLYSTICVEYQNSNVYTSEFYLDDDCIDEDIRGNSDAELIVSGKVKCDISSYKKFLTDMSTYLVDIFQREINVDWVLEQEEENKYNMSNINCNTYMIKEEIKKIKKVIKSL